MQITLTQEERDYIKSQYIERVINLEVERTIDNMFHGILNTSSLFEKLITDRLSVLIKQGELDQILKSEFDDLIKDGNFLSDVVSDGEVYDLLVKKIKKIITDKL